MTSWFRLSGDNLNAAETDGGPSRVSASYRDGKFANLSEFMKVDQNDKSLLQGYMPIGNTHSRPGIIIHICDEKSRLDRRVMLVLRKSSTSFMCLTFCSHWPPPGPEDHWRVWDDGKAKIPGENPKMQALEVVLQPYAWSTTKVSPQPGVTINFQDIWNVENEVTVKVLGEVASGALPPFVKAVKESFCQALDEAVPPASEKEEHPKGRRDSRQSGYFVRVPSQKKKEKK